MKFGIILDFILIDAEIYVLFNERTEWNSDFFLKTFLLGNYF